jgi:hypothetical protein
MPHLIISAPDQLQSRLKGFPSPTSLRPLRNWAPMRSADPMLAAQPPSGKDWAGHLTPVARMVV